MPVFAQKSRHKFYQLVFDNNSRVQFSEDVIRKLHQFAVGDPDATCLLDKSYFKLGSMTSDAVNAIHFLMMNQSSDIRKVIIQLKVNRLLKVLIVGYADLYPGDAKEKNINEFWNFIEEALKESITWNYRDEVIQNDLIQFYLCHGYRMKIADLTNMINHLKTAISMKFLEGISNFPFAEFKKNFDVSYEKISQETQRLYLANTRPAFPIKMMFMLLILSLVLHYQGLTNVRNYVGFLGFVFCIYNMLTKRELKSSTRVNLAKKFQTKIRADYNLDGFDVYNCSDKFILCAISLQLNQIILDKTLRKKEIPLENGGTKIIYTRFVDFPSYDNKEEKISGYTYARNLPSNTESSINQQKIQPPLFCKSSEITNNDVCIIQGRSEANKRSRIAVTFANVKKLGETQSDLIASIKRGDYSFVSAKNKSGFKWVDENHYKFKLFRSDYQARWIFEKTGKSVNVTEDKEGNCIPEYQCITYGVK